MRIAPVVVWFNPNEDAKKYIENIKTYSIFFEKVYIVDNSQSENAELAAKIENSAYLSNKNKGGIAGALNMGAKAAADSGFDWIMTMDQDSRFEPGVAKEYAEAAMERAEKEGEVASFTLVILNENRNIPLNKLVRFKVLSPAKRLLLGKKGLPPAGYVGVAKEKTATYSDCIVINSANIVSLDAWEEIGGYDEKLFIDGVDFDFSKRILLAGYKIVKFNWLGLVHRIGEKKKSLFRQSAAYSGLRLYYIFRNFKILAHKYPDEKEFKRLWKKFFVDNCVFSASLAENWRILFRARRDFRKYLKTGKIERSIV